MNRTRGPGPGPSSPAFGSAQSPRARPCRALRATCTTPLGRPPGETSALESCGQRLPRPPLTPLPRAPHHPPGRRATRAGASGCGARCCPARALRAGRSGASVATPAQPAPLAPPLAASAPQRPRGQAGLNVRATLPARARAASVQASFVRRWPACRATPCALALSRSETTAERRPPPCLAVALCHRARLEPAPCLSAAAPPLRPAPRARRGPRWPRALRSGRPAAGLSIQQAEGTGASPRAGRS